MVRECSSAALAAVDHHLLDLLDAAGDRGELDEAGLGGLGNDLGQRGFAHARRTPEDHGAGIVALDLHAQRLAGPDEVLLAKQFVEAARAHALRQRRAICVGQTFGGGLWSVGLVVEQAHRRAPAPRFDPLEERCGLPEGVHDRCRDASYSSTLAATAAFRLSTGPGQGIVIWPSAAPSDRRRDTVALVADDESHGTGQRRPDRRARRRATWLRKPSLRPLASCSKHSASLAASSGTRKTLPADARTAFGIPRAHGSRQAHDARCAKSLCRAQNRAQVSGILNAGQNQHKRFLMVLVENMRPRPIRRLNQRCNRLRRFGRQRRVEQLLRQLQNSTSRFT